MYCCAVCFPALREQQRPHFNVQTQISERLQIKSDPISSASVDSLQNITFQDSTKTPELHPHFHKKLYLKTPPPTQSSLSTKLPWQKKGEGNPGKPPQKSQNQSEGKPPKVKSPAAAALSQLRLLVPWARIGLSSVLVQR